MREHLVDAGGRSLRLRVLTLALAPFGAACIVATPWTLTSLTDVDGALEPLVARVALAALLALVGLLCTAGIWAYTSVYVTRLRRHGDWAKVTTQGLLWPRERRLSLAMLHPAQSYEGRLFIPGEALLNTPFRTIAVTGWRLPLLVDDQSPVMDSAGLDALLRQGARLRQTGE
ncbi:MAG: hypothetical protein AAF909_05465 [Pseudomonadota bacterium]